jgi:hypothetical protein
MSLKDLLTSKIKEARHETEHFEHTLGEAGEKASEFGKELIGALGVGMVLYKGFEFIEKSAEEFENLEKANAQLEAGLRSTGEAAGLSFEALEEGQEQLRDKIDYSRAAIADMQSQLLTFPAVTKKTFGEASMAIADMATRLHAGLDQTAIQVGKALQDPVKGITALHRVGVNFSETQKAMIKNFVETGQSAKAQQLILKELNTEFGGSAEAAAAVNKPMFEYQKSVEKAELMVGKLVDTLKRTLMPILTSVINGFMASVHWMQEHKTLMEIIGYVVATVAAGYLVYTGIIEGVVLATKIWTAAQWLLNAAMTANPLALVVIAIAAVTAAVIYCYNHFATFRAVLWGVWETIKEFGRIVGDVFMGVGKVIKGALTLSPSLISEGYDQTVNAISNAGTRLGRAFQVGYQGGLADFAKSQAAEGPKSVEHHAGKMGAEGAEGKKGATAKATGNKSVNITIKIDNLVREFSVNTKNTFESKDQIKQNVVQALLSAVNDSQIVAGE